VDAQKERFEREMRAFAKHVIPRVRV
jgi:hypothetical protein